MTKLLERYLKTIEQEKEKKRLEILSRAKGALQRLSKEIPFKKAYVFGSILKKKRFYFDSDVDIAIAGLDDEDFFYCMSRLSDLLGRDVDVIQLEGHHLKDKIMREGVLWKRQN